MSKILVCRIQGMINLERACGFAQSSVYVNVAEKLGRITAIGEVSGISSGTARIQGVCPLKTDNIIIVERVTADVAIVKLQDSRRLLAKKEQVMAETARLVQR